MITSHLRNSVNRSPLRRGFILIPLSLVLTFFWLAPMAQAVGPDTDGAIPGSNNGEGIGVLVSRTTGIWNTGTGFEALNHLTAGNQNTATGLRALFSNTTGGFNTATGVYSLFGNTSGFFNSAAGAYSLAHNTDGNGNTANGYSALYFTSVGIDNTATGVDALYFNTTGNSNTAIGGGALFFSTTGSNNTALGLGAGNNITTADNVIAIGAGVFAENVSDTCYIGNIFGVTSAGGTAVYVNSDGKLGTVISSQRFKDEIEPMDKASEAILALKPITFRYKQEIDPARSAQFGLVAEDVEKVNPNLVVRDREGKVNTVRYEAINAMLLNEFLKEHRKVEELKFAQEKQQAMIAQQQKQIEALTAGLQKVSAQVEMSRPAPQTVLNNQ